MAHHARVDDPQTWASYARARRTRGMSGLGLMLMDLDHIVVGDLDHCRDPASGELTAWARELLDKTRRNLCGNFRERLRSACFRRRDA